MYVPGIKVVRGDQTATILWPDFGAEENYVIQLEQVDGTWKSVEKDVEPADTSLIEGPVGPVDNQATVQDLANDQSYTARIASAETLEQAEMASEPAVDLSVGGPRGGAMARGLANAVDGDGTAVVTPPIGISPFAVPPATGNTSVITVKVGGDRSGQAGVTGLSGVTLQLYDGSTGTPGAAVAQGSWGTCVSDGDGDCSFVVPIGAGGVPVNTRFWIQRTGSPSGWFGLNSLVTGAIDNTPPLQLTPYRFRTGASLVAGQTYRSTPPGATFMNATGNETRDASGGIWQTSRNNPVFPASCGLNVALVLDVSGSVDADLNNLKTAAKTFTNSLVGTPSQVALFTFSTNAPANNTNNQNRPLIPVSTQAGADQVNAWIGTGNNNSPGRTGLTSGGSTNWDRGFAQVAESAAKFDVAVVITDGNPTVYANPAQGPGNFTRFREMENGVFSANAIKKEGTRVIAFGVGSGVSGNPANLQAISGTTVNSDYYQTTNYDLVGQALRALALGNCKGTITVVKQLLPSGSSDLTAATPAGGWTFGAQPASGVTASPTSGQTASGTGALSFDLTFPGGSSAASVALTETPQAGYTLFQQGGKNATCRRLDTNAPVTVVNNGPSGFNVDGQRDYPISCTVYNQENPPQAKTVKVNKTWVNGLATDEFTLKILGENGTTVLASGVSTSTGGNQSDLNVANTAIKVGDKFQVAETAGSNTGAYDQSVTCVSGPNDTPLPATDGKYTVPNADVSCTFTNSRTAKTVKVNKTWVNGLATDEFTLKILGENGTTVLASGVSTSTGGNQSDLNVANTAIKVGDKFQVAETAGSNTGAYDQSVTCVSGPNDTPLPATDGKYTVPNADVSCTFTNSRTAKTVKVNKTWVNGLATDEFTLKILGENGTTVLASGVSTSTGGNQSDLNVANTAIKVGDKFQVAGDRRVEHWRLRPVGDVCVWAQRHPAARHGRQVHGAERGRVVHVHQQPHGQDGEGEQDVGQWVGHGRVHVEDPRREWHHRVGQWGVHVHWWEPVGPQCCEHCDQGR